MPTYEWKCHQGHSWDVVSTMADRDNPQKCPDCLWEGTRQMTCQIARMSASAWNNQTFNPALGCYTKNDQDARRIAKSRGYEEIGNEPPDKIHAHFDKQREETRQRRWDEVDRVKQFD